jgi:hypothetical protein
MDAARFATALASNTIPLTLTLNMDVKNPNKEQAAMSRMDWRMFIDDTEIIQGAVNDRVAIAGNGGIATLPVQVSVDLRKVLSGKSGETIRNFAFNLAGESNQPTRFMMRIKPTIDVLGYQVDYPDFLDVKMDFTSGMGKTIREGIK